MSTAMPGHRLAGVLVDDERVPRREQGSGERGDHDRVVDVRDDAEAHVGPDDEHAGLDRLAALDRHRERLPARLRAGRGCPCRSRRRGRRRPRASRPPIVIRTCAKPTGTDAKLRQPRTLSYSPVPVGRDRRDDQHAPEDAHPVRARRSRGRASPSGSGRARGRDARATRGTGTRAARATGSCGDGCRRGGGHPLSLPRPPRCEPIRRSPGQLLVAVQVLALGPLDDLLADEDEQRGRRTMMPTKM